MKIVIPGGSGLLGAILADTFHGEGHEVIVLSRHPVRRPWRVLAWDGATLNAWAQTVDGSDAVINLAGRSVNCRYTTLAQSEILSSRLSSTRVIGEAIAAAVRPPAVWLQSSTATIYSHRFDGNNDERTGRIGGGATGYRRDWDFSIAVARAWEATLAAAVTPRTRKVALRSAMVMAPGHDGAFGTLLALVRRGLGGAAGGGRQFISWIHDHDFINAVRWLIARTDIEGIVNVSSPHPIPNRDFMRALRRAAHVPVGLASPRWLLALGAVAMRTEPELILKSRRVVPGRLLEAGFAFRFPHWDDAARDLVARTVATAA